MTLMDFIIFIFEIYFLFMGFIIGNIVILKLRQRGKVPVLVLKPSKKYEWKLVKPKGDQLEITKDWKPSFESTGIFREEKSFLRFWRLPKEIMIAIEKLPKVLNFKNMSDENVCALSHHWTSKEIKDLINKEIGLALTKQKPMSMGMFLLLFVFMLIQMILTFAIASRIGMF
jgi:hypothetical protein